MLIGHKECILKMRLKRGSGKEATERGIRSGQAEKQAQMRRRAREQGKGTEAKGDGVTEEGKSPSSEGRCAPVGATIMRGNYHIQPYPEHEAISNSTQPASKQTDREEHAHVLLVCLPEHDDQRRSGQKVRLVDVRRRE